MANREQSVVALAARLSNFQKGALTAFPITIEPDGCLPQWAPPGGTIKGLVRRQLAHFDPNDGFEGTWVLTPLGEAVRTHVFPGDEF